MVKLAMTAGTEKPVLAVLAELEPAEPVEPVELVPVEPELAELEPEPAEPAELEPELELGPGPEVAEAAESVEPVESAEVGLGLVPELVLSFYRSNSRNQRRFRLNLQAETLKLAAQLVAGAG